MGVTYICGLKVGGCRLCSVCVVSKAICSSFLFSLSAVDAA
uniref:Uncharacterized protein n=1 Tax=Anguilla anguilla TaxID=7936 RepID=A0A0E9TX09_ANGAN